MWAAQGLCRQGPGAPLGPLCKGAGRSQGPGLHGPRQAHQGLAYDGMEGPEMAQGGPQGPRGAHKGPAHKGPDHLWVHL